MHGVRVGEQVGGAVRARRGARDVLEQRVRRERAQRGVAQDAQHARVEARQVVERLGRRGLAERPAQVEERRDGDGAPRHLREHARDGRGRRKAEGVEDRRPLLLHERTRGAHRMLDGHATKHPARPEREGERGVVAREIEGAGTARDEGQHVPLALR